LGSWSFGSSGDKLAEMTSEQLLVELEPLTFSQRLKRMIELGRLAAGTAQGRPTDESIASLLKALGNRNSYERRLALYACLGSRDGSPVAAAISDPSNLVRTLACHLAPMLCDDATVVDRLNVVDRVRRLSLIRGLRRQGRRTPVDAFLDAAIARGERLWVELLPFGSASCVARHTEAFSSEASMVHWRRLARHHPGFCAELLTRIADATDELDARLRANAKTVLPVLGNRVPDAAVTLVRSLARHLSFAELSVDVLAIRRPNDVGRLVLEAEPSGQFGGSGIAHRLDPPLLTTLLKRQPHSFHRPERWLGRLPRVQRQGAYEICALSWRDREGLLPPAIVALLPEAKRHREGRRHLELPALATRPAQRIAYAAFLSWIEMRSVVDPLLRDPDAEIRGAAISSLVSAVRFNRDRLGEMLALLTTRRNEQDPVRVLMLNALSALPPGRWKAEHLEPLGVVLRHALDAADASAATGAAAERIVVGLVPFHPDWSRRWLATIVAERGMLSSPLSQRLSNTDVKYLAPSLLPVLQSWQTREREGYLLNAARLLGRRLRVFDGLADILESLARSSASDSTSQSALSILADERRDRFSNLVPELIKQDPTWGTRPVVCNYLHLHRQDLLGPCLGRVAYRGRFSTGQTRFFLPVSDGFWRWTPTQQATLALTLEEVAQDAKRDNPAVLSVIHQLAAMPDIAPRLLIELAGLDNSRMAVRDAALRALGRLDATQGLPTLLQALNDDRGRIAIYGLRQALLQMPPAPALQALQAAPFTQVTIAKEVVRLVGELRTEDAYAQLLAYDKRDLHRDVRAALLRALWSYLDRVESWNILQRAVASGETGQADVASRIPADTLNADGQLRLAVLLAALLSHPDAKVRVSVLQRLSDLPLSDPRRVLVAGLLSAIASRLPDESSAAASALFSTYVGRQAEVVGQTTSELLENRRAVNTLVEALCGALIASRRSLVASARAVLSALSADPLTITLQTRLAVLTLFADDLVKFLGDAAAAGTLHADALTAGMGGLSQLAAQQGPASMEPIEQSLAGSADDRLRRLALASLVAATERNQAWSEDQLVRLMNYRQDASPLVAGAAQFTFPVGADK